MDDDTSVSSQAESDSQSTIVVNYGRCPTRLKQLMLRKEQWHIEFNQKGDAVGQNRKVFKSYVGVLGRSKTSILKDTWDKVEEEVKKDIWDSLKLKFDVPEKQNLRTKWIKYAGERWKQFKTVLTRRYIHGKLSHISPCVKYKYIKKEVWEQFKISREDPSYLEKREKGKKLQSHNKYPHRLSRGGYELLEERIIAEKMKKREASGDDDMIVDDPPSPPPRHELWKRARQKPSGDFTSEESRIVAEKIDSLVEKNSQGIFVSEGRQDILTEAYGRPEHPGRVRGVGRGVTITEYFGRATRHDPTKVTIEQLEIVKAEITQQIKEDVVRELLSMGFSPNDQTCTPTTAPGVRTKDSYIVPILVENDESNVLYKEVVSPQKHCDKLKMIEKSLKEVVSPQKYCDKLKVIDQSSKKVISPQQSTPNVNILDEFLMELSKPRVTDEMCLEHDNLEMYYIGNKAMLELYLGNQELCITILQFWCTYMHRLCISKGNHDLYEIVDPSFISKVFSLSDIKAVLQKKLKLEKEVYLCPYLKDHHWQLLILCPKKNIVVLLCSFGRKANKEIKSIVDTVMEAYNFMHGEINKKPIWEYPKVHRQRGSTECGFYVMHYMLNIVSADIVDSWNEIFKQKGALPDANIKDVQLRCASLLTEFLKVKNKNN